MNPEYNDGLLVVGVGMTLCKIGRWEKRFYQTLYHSDNDQIVECAWGQWYINGHDGPLGEYELRFWDWSQTGPDTCYGSGCWMPVTDPIMLSTFPEQWKRGLLADMCRKDE